METPNKETSNTSIKLSIQVSLNGLSFCALLPEEQKIVFFKEVSFVKKLNPIEVLEQIQKIYEDEEFLQKETPEVTLLYSNELYSLVPAKFFKEENASDYLKFNTKILETDFVAHDELEEAGMMNVFIPYTNINNFFFEKYGEFEYKHCISVLVDSVLKDNRDQVDGVKMYLNCYTRGFDLVVVKNGKLLLANSFACNTKEDFIYYILFTAEQLELDPLEFELILLGKITANSDYYKIAYTYIKHIRFLDNTFGFIFAANGKPPVSYMHYTLLKTLQ